MSHYKPYPAYKDSGVEWLGKVPEHWRKFKVGRNTPFTIGWTPSTVDSSNYSDDVAWVNISDLGPEVIRETAKGISEKALLDKGATMLPIGTLLFSFKLTVGAVSFLGVPAVTNEAIAAFPPAIGVDAKFFYYVAPEFIPKFGRENIYGSLLLNQELIQSAHTYFPPIEEQSCIAAHLDRETTRIDTLITKKTRFIELLREKRQALITHAVTKGLDPNVKMKDSGVEWLGEVPEHWIIGPYKTLIQIENGSDYKDVEAVDGYPVIGSGGAFAYASQKMYEGESVLLGRKGTIDKPLYVNGAFWTVDTMYWSIVKSGVCGRFAYYVATTIPFDMYSTNTALPSMTKSVLGAHPIAFPDFHEQLAIAAHLDRKTTHIDTMIAKSERSIELLKERRSALITAAVTGQIDLREAA